MAITGKETAVGIILFLFGFVIRRNVNGLQCLSQNNEPVDWFIAYKLSFKRKDVPHDSFFYMDAESTEWKFSHKTMKEKGQAVYNTLNQIYKTSSEYSSLYEPGILYLMYNDQRPDNMCGPQPHSIQKGHTKGDQTPTYLLGVWSDSKLFAEAIMIVPRTQMVFNPIGVIGFDSQKGFWLIHSIPRFPPIRSKGYSLQNNTWGQTFLCISMETDTNLDKIGVHLLYTYPDIYDNSYSSYFASKFPNMADAMKGKHVTDEKMYHESILRSVNGVAFHSFAKSAYFHQDLYSELLAPQFDSTLFVQSWQSGQGGKMVSNCTSQNEVLNIESIEFKPYKWFKSTTDHSKWTVTDGKSSTWTCIGGINRMESQKKRGGGATCFQNKQVWQNFFSLIKSHHPCGK